MGKKTQSQLTSYIYGIDRQGQVASITVWKKGGTTTLTRTWPDMRTFSHVISVSSRLPREEASAVFNLHDIIEVPVVLDGAASTKQRLEELEDKAAAYREELANAKPAEPTANQ